MLDLTPALPTFVITLREGVEAALVVGIVLAYLKKADQSRLNPWVYSGIGSGLMGSAVIGLAFAWVFQTLGSTNSMYAPVVKPFLEGVFGLAAIAMLSWMLIWMTQQARQMKRQVEDAVQTTLHDRPGAGWGLFGLILLAVLREGFETVLFISANLQQGWLPVAGAIAGLVSAILIGILLFQFGVQINLRQFFQMMGVFLLLIVAGLVVSSLGHLDTALSRLASLNTLPNLCWSGAPSQAEASCFLGAQVWDLRTVLPERQFPGVMIHTLFGYEDQLYLVQAIGYSVFMLAVGGHYLRTLTQLTPTATRPPTPQPAPQQD